MNIRLVLFSGIMSAIVGGVVGLCVAEIERNPSSLTYKSQYVYQDFYRKHFTIAGAGIGFVVGAALQCVRELQTQRDNEIDR